MEYYFFNSVNGDRKYNAESFADWLFPFFTTGVFNGGFQVLADSGMNIKVTPGYANIEGKVAHSKVIETLQLDSANSVLNRIDNVVLRKDEVNRKITLEIVKGSSSENPVPAEPTRNDLIYEIVLAQIFVGASVIKITQSAITDTRMDSNLCGWVISTIKEVDFSQIVQQFESYFSEFKQDSEQDFDTWFETIKGKLNDDVAGSLQNQISQLEELLIQLKNEKLCKHSFLSQTDIDNILDLNYEEQEDDPSCGDFTINAESITQSEINDICI